MCKQFVMCVDLNLWCDWMSLPVTTKELLSWVQKYRVWGQQTLSGRKSPGVVVTWDLHSLCFPLIFCGGFAHKCLSIGLHSTQITSWKGYTPLSLTILGPEPILLSLWIFSFRHFPLVLLSFHHCLCTLHSLEPHFLTLKTWECVWSFLQGFIQKL